MGDGLDLLDRSAEEEARPAGHVRSGASRPPRAHRRPRSRRGPLRRLREAVSVALCLLEMASAALTRASHRAIATGRRQLAELEAASAAWRSSQWPMGGKRARGGARPRPTRQGAVPWTPRRLGMVCGAVVAAALLLGAMASGPLLRIVATPLAHSIAADGGPAPLAQRSEVFAADGTRIASLHDGTNRRIVPLREIPDVMRHAVLAAEDQRFSSHDGYDVTAMTRALVADLRARAVTQGGSTITQQLAKLNYVGTSQSVVRKAKELLYAVALESRFTKEELLERYLNQVYFGSGGYGVAAAAEEFFGVAPGDLAPEQAALLAGLIRAPAALDPRQHPEAALERRNQVLAAMTEEGYLSAEEEERARQASLGVVPSPGALATPPYVVDALHREFVANPAFGRTAADRLRLLETGGLRIHLTLDPHLQDAAAGAARRTPDGLAAAMVALDPRTGAIRAIHNSGQSQERQSDVATQGRRQPGSAFKPLVAAAAFEAGMPEYQVLAGDGPIEIDVAPGLPPWRVDNFAEADYGLVDVREALISSVNTAFAQLAAGLGTGRLVDVARRVGIDVDAAMGTPAQRGPAIGIGGLAHGVSPLEIASAYGTFANGGRRARPYLIDSVVAPDGRVLYRAEVRAEPAIDPAVAGTVVDMLQDVVDEGTGTRAQLWGWEPMGKTGTSDGSADAWFVGAVPELATAVWVGHADSTRAVGAMTGGGVAAPMWRDLMAVALEDATPVPFDSGPPLGPRTALELPTVWATR